MKAQFDPQMIPQMISYVVNAVLLIILLSVFMGALNDPCHKDLATCQSQKTLLENENIRLNKSLSDQIEINKNLTSQLDSCIRERNRLDSELANYNQSLEKCEGNLTECSGNLTNCNDLVNQIKFGDFIISILLPTTFVLSLISILTQFKFLLYDRDEKTARWRIILSFIILALAIIVFLATIFGYPIFNMSTFSVKM
jgi:hypothetical protein